MKKIAIISTSLAPKSRSRIVLRFMYEQIQEIDDVEAVWFDVQDHPLPLYTDGVSNEHVVAGKKILSDTDAWVIGGPVHNWGAASSTINFLNYCLDKKVYSYKPFTLIAGAGTSVSFLAMDGLGRNIRTEVKGVEVGPALVCAGDSVDRETGNIDDKTKGRLEERIEAMLRFVKVS